ncbi:MAG: HAD family hydrolase [Planctomycetes bacterium B3_Pla]|nr:MAG: HAD family hydrolase [Planctomycetes bacterium B3_Pla]
MEFQAILFDLDGTLLDTLADIANSTNAALSRLGFPAHPVDVYRYFLGDGMDHLVRRALPEGHHDGNTLDRCKRAILDEYKNRWAENTKPYPGITELLCELEKRGIPKAVLSNKPDVFTKQTIEKLLPDFHFEIVRGAKPSVPVKPDPTAAFQIANELGIAPQRFIYIGDTDTDMRTAVSAGMFPAGALWGFRTAEELSASGAKALLRTPDEVLYLLAE